MAKLFIEDTSLTAIGDAIRSKTGGNELLSVPTGMVDAINSITTGGGGDLPEEAFTLTGNCGYMFYGGQWTWFIDNYGNQITTEDINIADYMFSGNKKVETIPFAFNFYDNGTPSMNYMFSNANNIKKIPKMVGPRPYGRNVFANCYKLEEIVEPEFIYDSRTNSGNSYLDESQMFSGCYRLRKLPMGYLKVPYNKSIYNYSWYYSLAAACFTLDEIVGLSVYTGAKWTNNAFYMTVSRCYHLKDFTFALDENNMPYVVQWKSQVLDLGEVGYTTEVSQMTGNGGLDSAYEMKDDATYQALKNNPDAWSSKVEYSRYNHDSAVNTINSLPDTSAYLATAGGTNAIIFTGNSGSLTDGGAINTMTEEEIAVAAAKGWTVNFV